MPKTIHFLVILFSLFPIFGIGQVENDTLPKSSIWLELTESKSFTRVAFADVFVKQNGQQIASAKTNFDGRAQLEFQLINTTDSIEISILKSPFVPYVFMLSVKENQHWRREIMLETPEELLATERREIARKKDRFIPMFLQLGVSQNRGFGFNVAYGLFGFIDDGSIWSGGIIGHGIGGSLGFEGNWNNNDFLVGPKLTAEYHLIGGFLGAKMSVWYLSNLEEGAWKFSPEIGVSAFGFGSIMVGYNFSMSEDHFSTIDGWRFSVSANIPFF